jgi:prephenate dehydratase
MTIFGALGPSGTFSEFALQFWFKRQGLAQGNNSPQYILKDSISAVFHSLHHGECSKILVPVENSINGKVETTLDHLLSLNTNCIESEFTVPIQHALLGNPKLVLDEVKFVLSHYQALGQCHAFLSLHLPSAIQVATESSASAASYLVSNDANGMSGVPNEANIDNTVIIGRESLASLYGLKVIAQRVNDNPNNITRFWVIGDENKSISGNDKTSLVFTTPNSPGALHDILGIFSKNNINLISIASRPSKKKLGEYFFYVDLEGHQDNPVLQTALSFVKSKSEFYKLFGSFPMEVKR